MRIFFDQGTPVPLRHHLPGRQISTAYELGWGSLENGELLQQAENHGFEILITTDRNLKYQQNLASCRIAVVVLSTTSWPRIKSAIPAVLNTVNNAHRKSYIEVSIPYVERG